MTVFMMMRKKKTATIMRIKNEFLKNKGDDHEFFRTDAEKEFNVEFITSPEIENSQQRWNDIINGSPFWVDPKKMTSGR